MSIRPNQSYYIVIKENSLGPCVKKMKSLLFLLIAVAFGADLTPTLGSFLATINNERLLNIAKLCKEIYKLPEGVNNGDLTKILWNKELIGLEDKVIMQGFRHGDQLGSIVIKEQTPNRFKIVFSGTETLKDWAADAMMMPTKEDALGKVNELMKSAMPHKLLVRERKTKQIKEHNVDVHMGFKNAGKDFLVKLFTGLKPYIDTSKPLYFEIYGHSMGGALAAQCAYQIKKRMAVFYEMSRDQISVDVITFASAGFFKAKHVGRADKMIGASHSMVNFYRKNDFARDLTALAGFINPGHAIYLDNFVRDIGSVKDYIERIKDLEETPFEIIERAQKEGANHSMGNYIATIKAGIQSLLVGEQTRASDAESNQ